MVLVEASRQMVNAVTEKYFSNSEMIYLANEIKNKFSSFVYPFYTKLIYRVVSSNMKAAGNGKMKVIIEFVQAEELKGEILFEFTILQRSFVTYMENKAIASMAV